MFTSLASDWSHSANCRNSNRLCSSAVYGGGERDVGLNSGTGRRGRMSLQILNDENFGCDIAAEPCDFLFTPPPGTGRPSILRPSQRDNLPPKSAVKGMKVTFQTPMRDPQTHRIVTPSMANKQDGMFTLDDCAQALEQLHLSSSHLISGDSNITSEPTTLPEDEIQLMSMGAYTIDFDNLGDINPFTSGNKMVNSPMKAEPAAGVLAEPAAGVLAEPAAGVLAEPAAGVLAEPAADLEVKSMWETPIDTTLADQTMSLLGATQLNPDSPVIVQLRPGSVEVSSKSSLDDTVPLTESNPAPEEPTRMAADEAVDGSPTEEAESVSMDTIAAGVVQNPNSAGDDTSPPDVPNSPPLPKATYKFDPDQIDCIDPFNTGGSKVQNSPKNPDSENGDNPKGEPLKLEFDFGGGDATVKKPPPKLLGKRLGVKPLAKKVAPKVAVPEKPKEQAPPQPSEPEGDVIVPKASYNFDWDKFDDPNFNPFGSGGTKIAGSPKAVKAAGDAPCVKEEDSPPKADTGEAVEESSKKDDDDASGNIETTVEEVGAAEEKTGDVTQENKVDDAKIVTKEPAATLTEGNPPETLATLEYNALPPNVGLVDSDFGATLQMDFTSADEFDFKPATELEGFGQPIEIDYLENFGSSSFKESALRKQSLYLKFDPLLRESPKKSAAAGTAVVSDVPLRSGTELFGSLPEPSFPVNLCLENEEKPRGLDLLGTFTISDNAPLIPDPINIVPPSDPFLLPSDVGAIVEVLKYSQMDMDGAIEQVRLEVQAKDLEVVEWKNKHKKLYLEYLEMGKIVSEFESTITQMLEDSQRQKELSKQELHKAVEEKQQVQMDLNSMEKSFSELFKRFEKQKDVLEGYRKVTPGPPPPAVTP
ncbi:unnamed protein product [Ranitomeya imitator]|uniref:Transforming acidic coiled-coil-containing protein C-terminal domain-containing protein n=1 Tax=Ranitomeya imitator TaxID=111125 RepID=A0ABN9KU46_9NEOB|nr:unnamed protein product [Ranitomeya imitator]